MARLWTLVIALAVCGAARPGRRAPAPHLEGSDLGLLWALPFANVAVDRDLPIGRASFWHHHFGNFGFGALLFWCLSRLNSALTSPSMNWCMWRCWVFRLSFCCCRCSSPAACGKEP